MATKLKIKLTHLLQAWVQDCGEKYLVKKTRKKKGASPVLFNKNGSASLFRKRPLKDNEWLIRLFYYSQRRGFANKSTYIKSNVMQSCIQSQTIYSEFLTVKNLPGTQKRKREVEPLESIHRLTNVGLRQCSHGNMRMRRALNIFCEALCGSVCELHDADSTFAYAAAWNTKKASLQIIKTNIDYIIDMCFLFFGRNS